MSFLRIRVLLIMSVAAILTMCVSALAQTSLPTTIHEQEGPFAGTWSLNGKEFQASWNNGAAAALTVQSFTSASVIIERTDLPHSVSAGMTATYTGQISDAGNSIVNGRVTWTWPGHRGYPATGTWTASWTSCSDAVSKLSQQQSPTNEAFSAFHRIQSCIATNACQQESKLENPKWLDSVVPDFMAPLLAMQGKWKIIVEKCHTGIPIFGDEYCRFIAARHHIFVDLQNALDRDGCGTDSDWKFIGNIVTACVDNALGPDWPAKTYADADIQDWRALVRQKCIAYRSGRHLPIF